MIRGVRELHAQKAPQTDFFLLSNSNEVYLSTILGCRGLRDVFTEVVTNPAQFEPSGLLRLRRRVPKDGPQHGCTVGCSANMCKGTYALHTRTLTRQDRSSMHSSHGTGSATTRGWSTWATAPTTSAP